MNKVYNSHDSLLYLIFYNKILISVAAFDEPVISIYSYRPSLCIYLPNCVPILCCNHDLSFFNLFNAHYQFLEPFNLNFSFLKLNGDNAVNTFYDSLHQSIIDVVPKCKFRTSTYSPWFLNELRKIVYLKKNYLLNTINLSV